MSIDKELLKQVKSITYERKLKFIEHKRDALRKELESYDYNKLDQRAKELYDFVTAHTTPGELLLLSYENPTVNSLNKLIEKIGMDLFMEALSEFLMMSMELLCVAEARNERATKPEREKWEKIIETLIKEKDEVGQS